MEKQDLNWILPEPILKSDLAEFDFPIVLKAILSRRGIKTKQEIKEYISPKELPDPYLHFPDLETAVNRIIRAINRQEKIAICGDYDADGMTSTALFIEALRYLSLKPIKIIPNRLEEGYGINTKIIENLKRESVNLIITVDNGVSAKDAIKLCNSLSIDLIITDHHTIPKSIPKVHSLIHPQNTPKDSPYKYLAGVGIAFIIIKCISDKISNKSIIDKSLDFFCIGTLADMSIIKGANRKLLRESLPNLYKTKSIGLKELIKLSGINYNEITSEDIGFKIAPRINAIGRIDNPNIIIDLLTENDPNKAKKLASYCEKINNKRRLICKKVLEEALIIIDKNNLPEFITIAQPNWHLGIIGLIASQIMNKFHRPVAILTPDGKGLFRASARAPNGFNLIKALENCSDLLETFGGHKAAAGFSIRPNKISSLELRLNHLVKSNKIKHFKPRVSPDCHINFNEITHTLFNSQYTLEPFGLENPKPIFWTRKCKLVEIHKLKGEHLRAKIYRDNKYIDAIDWNSTFNYKINEYIDIAYTIEMNRWKNLNKLQLNIVAVKEHQDIVEIILNDNVYRTFKDMDNNLIIRNSKGKQLSINDYKNLNILSDNKSSKKYLELLFGYASIALGDSSLYI